MGRTRVLATGVFFSCGFAFALAADACVSSQTPSPSLGGVDASLGQEDASSPRFDSGVTADVATESDAAIAADTGADASPPPDAGVDAAEAGQLSCRGLAPACGAAGTDDCCSTATTLPGGTGDPFNRDCDSSGTDTTGNACTPTYPAAVSSLRLEKYEVTVGRFRNFVAGYDAWRTAGHPAAGEGGDPHVTGTAWDASWTASLSPDAATLQGTSYLSCSSVQTWTTAPDAGTETLAINCVSWFDAAAFCLWDGGWLPTEDEWMYAASGGSENRAYPWSSPDFGDAAAPTQAQANWDQVDNEVDPVGDHPAGAGRWGHQDLGGNVSEWVWDWYNAYAGDAGVTCLDCVQSAPDTMNDRVARGGSWFDQSGGQYQRSANRGFLAPTVHYSQIGFRCARQ